MINNALETDKTYTFLRVKLDTPNLIQGHKYLAKFISDRWKIQNKHGYWQSTPEHTLMNIAIWKYVDIALPIVLNRFSAIKHAPWPKTVKNNILIIKHETYLNNLPVSSMSANDVIEYVKIEETLIDALNAELVKTQADLAQITIHESNIVKLLEIFHSFFPGKTA